jgi:hypothetical protein
MGTSNPFDPDNNFGYQYTPGLEALYTHHAEDPKKAWYSGDRTPEERIPTYRGRTNWDSVDIVAIATLVYHQHDGPYRAASLTWYRIALHIGHLKTQTQDAGGKLTGGWDPAKNDAAANFFQFIGASTWSMNDWIQAAINARDATLNVANAIDTARREMSTLFAGYQRDYIENGNPVPLTGDIYQWTGPHIINGKEVPPDTIKRDYDHRARQVVQKLSDAYAENWATLFEAHRFQGPTKAESPGTALQNRLPEIIHNLRKGLPGGGRGMPNPHNQQQVQALQAQLDQQIAHQKLEMEKALQDAAREAEAARQAALQQQQALSQVPAFPAIQVGQPGPSGALPPGMLPTFALPTSLTGLAATGPGAAGLKGPAGLGNFDLNPERSGLNRNLLGRSNLSGAGGMPGMPGGAGRGMGNPGLRGRLGAPGGPGAPGNPGSRSPLGGRRDDDRDKGRTAGFTRPESEEYLADLPTGPGQMTARLAGTSMGEDALTPPPGAGMPGRPGMAGRPAIPGQRGPGQGGPGQPGFPGQPGMPGGGRPVKPEDLAGRRQRTADAEANEDLMAPPPLLRPDLTGRKGLPVIDWDQVAGAEMGAERAMLGSRGAPAATGPGMAERLTGRRKDKEKAQTRPEQERTEDATTAGDELWTVATPETIGAPTETKVDDQRGKALGAN